MFKRKFRLSHDTEDLVSYAYLRQNWNPQDPIAILKRRIWLNLTEMRQEEIRHERQDAQAKRSLVRNFKAQPDPALQAIDNADEAEFLLNRLPERIKALLMLAFYHEIPIKALCQCTGQSRFQIHRQFKHAYTVMQKHLGGWSG